ncbi:ABC-three component system protein [Rhodopirellula bahusiensis]|uniref:ABC-three component system protein n=1 Tax=Rhodopirellula bahusiensis TaxID=2014065 RepID=UPI00117AA297|nr:ABC-three component system protein [Rhodopirellula bahusiensis]
MTSSLDTFKSIRLKPGLNLIVAEKSKGATERQTRNGSGKTSLVRIIDFLLGSKCDGDSIFRSQSLADEQFTLSFDLGGHRTSATRTGNEKNRIVVDGVYDDWPIEPKLHKESGEYRISKTNWCSVLGSLMFDLPVDIESYGPTFRAMISYFVRRESSGAFQEAQKQSSQQQNWDVQTNLSYLFGLDWEIPHALQQVRLKEKSLATLRKEAKGGALGALIGNIGELRTRLAVAEKEANRLKSELEGFQVLPEYHELEKEASALAIRISELTSENTLDLERVESLTSQLEVERSTDDSLLESVYREVGIVLPELVTKRLDDVRKFHAAIIQNRRIHLQSEIDDAKASIDRRDAEKEQLDDRRLEIMTTLNSHGALDQFSKLQEELSRQQATVEELKKKVALARQLDSETTELTIERAKIKQRLTTDLDEKADTLNDSIVIFEEFSKLISDHEGSLVIEPKENGPEFAVNVEGKESKGIRSMQIFCFDMTLAVLWSKRNAGPGFLVHDSHLFDGMDSRQVARAIEIGASQSKQHGFQYIICINSDQLEAAEFANEFDPAPYRNSVEITDASETGGLFGMRIK